VRMYLVSIRLRGIRRRREQTDDDTVRMYLVSIRLRGIRRRTRQTDDDPVRMYLVSIRFVEFVEEENRRMTTR